MEKEIKRANDMKISFIIPTYNTLELTKQCLDSLVATVDLQAHETIIVDDRSTDGTDEYLSQLPSAFKVIFNSDNQGYSKNCNRAAKIAHGELLCFCNSDLIFLPGWLPPLIQALQTLPDVGFIGNVQRIVGSRRIDHLGVKFLSDGRPLHIGWGRNYAPLRKYLTVSAVTAACCLTRKDLFLGFGGFSEAYANGFEDTDLCLRMLERGYYHYVVTASTVLHHVSASPGRHSREEENLKHFIDLWKETAGKISIQEEKKWTTLEALLHLHPFFRFFLYFQPFIRCF
jgi:GT2 family glycosyltransferase